LSVPVKKKNPRNNHEAGEAINLAKTPTVPTHHKGKVDNRVKEAKVNKARAKLVAIKTATIGAITATDQTTDRAPILAITATDQIQVNQILLAKAKTVGLKQKAEHL
jgi:hypothetical protein